MLLPTNPKTLDKNRSREELIQEITLLRGQLTEQSREIARLKEGESIAAEQLFRSLFVYSSDGMFIATPEGMIEAANPAACKMLGRTKEEIIRIGRSGIIDMNDPRAHQLLAEREHCGFIKAKELTGIKKSGEKFPIEIDSVILPTAPARALVTIRDVTARKHAEEAVQQSNERLRLAASAAHVGTYSRNLLTGEDYWSPEFLMIQGFSPDAFPPLEDGIPASVHPSDRKKVLAQILACTENPKQPEFNIKHRVILPSGEIRWMILRGRIEFDGQGHPIQRHGAIIDITEREHERQALQESESLYRAIGKNFPNGAIYVFNRDLRFRLAEGGALSALGYTREDLEGKTIREAMDAETCRMLEQRMSRVLAGESLHFETTLSGLVFSSEYVPIRNDSGEVILGMIVSHDITDVQKTREALRQAVIRYEQQVRLFEGVSSTTPDFVYLFDLHGRFQYANRRLLDVWGMKLTDVIGKTCRELGYEEWHHDMHMREIAQVIETKSPIKGEVPFKAPLTGIYGVYEYIFTPVLNPDGVVELIAGTTRDVTERKRAEEALAQNARLLRFVVENSPNYTFIQDHNLRYVWVGRVANPLTQEECLGRTDLDLLPPEDGRRLDEIKQRVLTEGQRQAVELQLTLKDGGHVFEAIYEPWRDAAGAIIGVAGYIRDVTNRKKAEQEREQLIEQLSREKQARSKQLQALAVELIEAEERERHRIAALLHDDLQQILAAARMQLQAACYELPQSPSLSNVEQMLCDCITKSRRLSHQLSPAILYHSGLFAALRWLCQQMEEQFGLRVQLDVEAAAQLENMPLKVFVFRAVHELLFNVVKHAGVKSARVFLSSPGNRMIVTVSDQGKGFDPAILSTLPEKAGLGLMSLRERASYIGGRLSIYSAPGQGSRFSLMIPLDMNPADIIRSEDFNPISPRDAEAISKPGRIRVLFADDHKVMRDGLTRMIQTQPEIEVVGQASNGREAVALAHQLRPDAIIMDIGMPEMDGVEATRRIKTELPGIRVIGLSMFEDQQAARNMYDAGADGFLIKTASSAELLRALYDIAGRDRNGLRHPGG